MGKFLARIGVIETPECWWCKEPVQSVEHLSKCRRWRKGQRRLVRELEKEGVSWQVQVERRWLAGLLANEKTATKLFKSNRNRRERRSKREGGRMGARKAKICLDRLRRGQPKSRSHSQRQDKAEMDK